MNLDIKTLSYIYGLFITDGWLCKHKEKINGVAIEVSLKDLDIIEKLHNKIPFSSIYYRNRDTNFKKNHKSVQFNYSRKDLPLLLVEMGFPIDDKTNNAAPPIVDYDELSFWRGVIDGDGSLGLKSSGTEFISLTTKSDKMKESFCSFLEKITGRKYNPKRNKRDNIYNIGCNGLSAKKVIEHLYNSIDNDSIFLDRKYLKMQEVLKIDINNS